MISLAQYYGIFSKSKDLTPARQANAQRLCTAVNRLIAIGIKEGVLFPNSPATKNQISTDVGGYRPQDCKTGAPFSKHKEGLALDLYAGLDGVIGQWVLGSMADKKSELYKLALELDLAFEHPADTVGKISHWLHVQIGTPKSGNRIYHP